jgi:hypothetical protein
LKNSGKESFLRTKPKYDHNATVAAADEYQDGVFAVHALTKQLKWDPVTKRHDIAVQFGLGRKLTIGAKDNKGRPVRVTPDCAIQRDGHYAVVAELKTSIKDENHWADVPPQLAKYDQDLHGWWTPDGRIATHDLVLLIPSSQAVAFTDFFRAGIEQKKWAFQRNHAVIGFLKEVKGRLFLNLRLEYGSLTSTELTEALRRTALVELDDSLLEDRKFLDQRPPLPFMLFVLWELVFVARARGSERGADGSVQLPVDVKELTKELQRDYGYNSEGKPGCVEIPQQSWVREALDALVDFRFAKRQRGGLYIVSYKRFRQDALEKWGPLCHKRELRLQFERERREKQPSFSFMNNRKARVASAAAQD